MRIILTILTISLLLGKISAQGNLQTGSATFSLPIFNWQDDKSRLSTTIALNYNSGSGLKTNDVASNVGQGWNLIAGGVVSRMTVGEPDDQQEKVGGVNDITKYPPGILYSTSTPIDGCPNALVKYPIYGSKNQLYKQHNFLAEDRELDRFSFSFNGRSGMFVLDWRAFKDNSGKFGFVLGDTKLKISFLTDPTLINNEIRTTISAFVIQDENGIIYRFNKLSLTRVLKTNFCDENLNFALTQPHFKSNHVYHESSFIDLASEIPNPWIVDNWFLTQMEDPLTHRKVNFAYNNSRYINTLTGASITYNENNNYSTISHLRTVARTIDLTNIYYPNADGNGIDHEVSFSYGDRDRFDFPGQYALSTIRIKYKGRPVSAFQFNTGYIMKNRWGSPATDQQRSSARLYLKSVQKFGVDLKESEQPYLFDYYMGDNIHADAFVPPAYSFAKDIWGFYNGDQSRAFDNSQVPLDGSINSLDNNQTHGLCFRRPNSNDVTINPKQGYARWGLLRQIVYPTGGSMRYEYEQNTGTLAGTLQDVGGVHVSKTSVSDGGYSNDCDHQIVNNYNYILDNGTSIPTSSLWGIEMPNNEIYNSNHYGPEKRYYYYKFPFGACSYRFQYPGLLYREQRYALNTGQQILQVVSRILDVVSVITTVIDVANLLAASGPGAIVSVVIDIIAGLLQIVLTCFTNQDKDTNTHIIYNADLNGSNPLPSQFSRVEVTESPGGTGKTVSEFLSSSDYAVWEPTNDEMSMKQRFAYWVYGNPKSVATYAATGEKLTETIYNYDMTYAASNVGVHPGTGAENDYLSCKCYVTGNTSQRNTDWENPSIYNPAQGTYTLTDVTGMKVRKYGVKSGRLPLIETDERIYKKGGSANQYAETVTKYDYDFYNYQVSNIEKTGSDGMKSYKIINYSASSYLGGEVKSLKDNNILNVPINIISYAAAATGNSTVHSEQVTEFTVTANGDIKPSRTLEQRFAAPAGQSFYQGPNSVYNPTYFETQTFHYDSRGNLIGLKDEGNHVVTNIYDYDDKYVVASVINADTTTDKPAYTSFETSSFGGWTMNGTPAYLAGGSTGSRSLALNNNSISATINPAKEYRLSLWANSGGISVPNATVLKSEPVINGYRYYEYSINQGTSTVTISGNSIIDELRLYPANARMRTVTYDPLIGKTSECDENNRITYYEYDAQGRLHFIKDDKGDVVKMYEYNIIRKQQGCPQSFSNLAVSETYTKDDCGTGYVGTDVIYTIPAGKYTSTISQDEVDQQVQNELDTYAQTYANTNGSCLQLYYNAALSQPFQKENCPIGYVGTNITYTVPANRYTSTISQADADEKAMIELLANGQAYANNNTSVSTGCTINYDPVWEGDENSQTRCGNGSNGAPTGHIAVYMQDVNPNSSTYQQYAWKDGGESLNCAYTPVQQGTCTPGVGYGQVVINGHPGDVLVIQASFGGPMGWNGQGNGAGGSLTINAGGQSANDYTNPHYYGTSSGFSLSATITVTMTSSTLTINTNAIINNSTYNTNASASVKVVSVNGVPTGSYGTTTCYGNSGGGW